MDRTRQHHVEALNHQAVTMARRGQVQAAEQLWSEALQLDPQAFPIRANLARLFFQSGRYENVLHLAHPLEPTLSCPAALAALIGQSALRLNQPAEALRWLTLADSLRPEEPSLQLSLSEALLACGHVQRATAILRHLVAAHPDAVEPHLNLALAMTEGGFLAEAASCYSSLLARWPQHLAVLMNAARFHLDHGDHEVARSIVDDLLALDPQSRFARSLLADLNRCDDALPQARLQWQALLDENPSDLDAHLPLIFSSMDRGDWSDAAERLQHAVACCKGPIPARLLAAWADLQPSQRSATFPDWSLDYSTLVHQQQLLDPTDPLLSQWINWVRADPSLIANRPGKPTVGGLQSHELLNRSDDPLSRSVLHFLRPAVDAYRTHRRDPLSTRNPPAPGSSDHYSGWAVVLRPGGQQLRHTHPEAELSGVLYLTTPPGLAENGSDQGCLWFSPNPLWQDDTSGLLVHPRPGLLVLFPSFLPHETIPFDSKGDRICIAFNVS